LWAQQLGPKKARTATGSHEAQTVSSYFCRIYSFGVFKREQAWLLTTRLAATKNKNVSSARDANNLKCS